MNVHAPHSCRTAPRGFASWRLASLLLLWGDGETTDGVTSGQDYVHTYAAAGTYVITLVATDTMGQTATTSKTVIVTAE